jgi:hypothetical protein
MSSTPSKPTKKEFYVIPVETNALATAERIKELGIVLGPVIDEVLEAQIRMKGQVRMSGPDWHATLSNTLYQVQQAMAVGNVRLARLKAKELTAASYSMFEQLLVTPERPSPSLRRPRSPRPKG